MTQPRYELEDELVGGYRRARWEGWSMRTRWVRCGRYELEDEVVRGYRRVKRVQEGEIWRRRWCEGTGGGDVEVGVGG